MVAVPLMKLFSMTVKTVAKPVAKRIKSEAEKHPTIRGFLHSMGQATNSLSLRISIRMAGHTTTNIKPLDEDKAVVAGGDLLAEGLVYGIGTALMVWEYRSSSMEKEQKDAAAKVKKAEEQRELAEALQVITKRLENLEASWSAMIDGKPAQQHGTITALDRDSTPGDGRGPSPGASRWGALGRFLGRKSGGSSVNSGDDGEGKLEQQNGENDVSLDSIDSRLGLDGLDRGGSSSGGVTGLRRGSSSVDNTRGS